MAYTLGSDKDWAATSSKRAVVPLADRLVALILLPVIASILAILFPVVLALQGRPFLYGSRRMSSCNEEFTLWKIRTMAPSLGKDCAVLGGHLAKEVTPVGAVLRKLRLDELPQIFNVLAGDMCFIGPRPPLPKYVRDYPELYGAILLSPPGITGLATVLLHRREQRLLSRCISAEEADTLYREHCIPRKARLDFMYQSQRSVALDLYILLRTLSGLWPKAPKRRSPRYKRLASTAALRASEPRRV